MSYIKQKYDLVDHPLASLSREDLNLITELVLLSGSLKDLAAAYGVTYPTIRLRLDRVIERLKSVVNGKTPDPLSDLLAKLVESSQLSLSNAHAIRDLARSLSRSPQKEISLPKGGDS